MTLEPENAIPWRLVAAMCTAEVLGMMGFATFATSIPDLVTRWSLTNTEAGWIGGVYYAGYTGAVPILVSLTDRVDPRRIYLISAAFGSASLTGFSLFANGFWTAFVFHVLAGAGLAGMYMPGLKVLSDRIQGSRQSRALAFYTSCFSVGAGLSFLVAGEIGSWFGWRWAFGAAAIGSGLAFLIVLAAVPPFTPVPADGEERRLLDFRPVLRNRTAMGFVIAYGAHAWELLAQRTWIVAFLTFSLSLQPSDAPFLVPASVIAMLINLAGVPASILGNELALRFGRVRISVIVGLVSAGLGCAIGFTAALPYLLVIALCLLYGIANYGDSATVTAGAVAAATRGQTGATMAVHSFFGFSGGFVGALVFGFVLDLAGGRQEGMAWGLAFASLGIAATVGPLGIALSHRPRFSGR